MIKYSINCESKHWLARRKKINLLINKSIKLHKELKFKKNIDYYCNFILVNDNKIKEINQKYRRVNKATDVLTFISDLKIKKQKHKKFCDIFLSAETIIKDAEYNNINFYDHLVHLVIHSLLHVNGFVHKKVNDFLKMQIAEIKILKKLQINNPYL